MVLKENWTSQDKFNCGDLKEIYKIILEIENKLGIISDIPADMEEKRNIQIGDDLSKKTIILEFPDDMYKDASFGEDGNTNIIYAPRNPDKPSSGTHAFYVYKSEKVARIGINAEIIYDANPKTGEVYKNLKEITITDNWEIVTEINKTLSAYKYIYVYMPPRTKQLGDFLLVEELQKIENNVAIIAKCVNTSYRKRNWYYLSAITYEDINRWAVILNIAYDAIHEESKNIITETGEELITENGDNMITEGS